MARTSYIWLDDVYVRTTRRNNRPLVNIVAPLGYINLIPNQPVFALTPECCELNWEAANTNLIFIGLTWSGLKSMIYHTRVEQAYHYTTDAVLKFDI
jgi:hypothetical protein